MYYSAFVKSNFLKTIATLSSFVFISLLLINPDAYTNLVQQENNVSADFLTNDYATDTYVVDGSLSDLQNVETNTQDARVVINKHVVQPKESLWAIAQKYNISSDQLKSLNNLVSDDLRAGQVLYVSPIQGFVYSVKQKTSLMVFANMYNINKEDLMRANNQTDDMAPYEVWSAIVIPNKSLTRAYDVGLLIKPEPKKVIVQSPTNSNKKVVVWSVRKVAQWGNTITRTPSAKTVSSRRQSISQNYGFAAWQCTAYAASKASFAFNKGKDGKLNIGRRGNANQWLGNAKKAWFKTSSKPSPWAIGVFRYGWSRSYAAGHVVIVESVDRENKKMKVSDMNYAGRGVVTVRWIDMNDDMTEATSSKQDLIGFIPVQ